MLFQTKNEDAHPSKVVNPRKNKVEIKINCVINLHKLLINKEENWFDFLRTLNVNPMRFL